MKNIKSLKIMNLTNIIHVLHHSEANLKLSDTLVPEPG